MATKKSKKKVKTQRIPTYKDAEGQYLAIDDRECVFKIGWYLPDEGDFGLYLSNEPTRRAGDETDLAIKTLREYCKEIRLAVLIGHDFEFETMNQAKTALRRVNAVLHSWKSNKPWPDWAKKAAGEGWQPPKGWSP